MSCSVSMFTGFPSTSSHERKPQALGMDRHFINFGTLGELASRLFGGRDHADQGMQDCIRRPTVFGLQSLRNLADAECPIIMGN